MAFRPSLAALSKASRLPLTSKQANKDFYKGASRGSEALLRRVKGRVKKDAESCYFPIAFSLLICRLSLCRSFSHPRPSFAASRSRFVARSRSKSPRQTHVRQRSVRQDGREDALLCRPERLGEYREGRSERSLLESGASWVFFA